MSNKKGGSKYSSLMDRVKLKLDSMADPVCRVIDKSAESILDVGCGQGYPMRLLHLVMKPGKTVGVDLFKKYIKEAKRHHLHDDYVLADIRKMKFKRKSFDVVLASMVIEHLPARDGKKFIKDLEKIARKQVIIVTNIGEMYHPPVDGNELQLHKSHYYPEDFEKLGYKVVKYGRKSLFGDNGVVHKINNDLIRKAIFFTSIILSPLYYAFPRLADYYFVAYKNL